MDQELKGRIKKAIPPNILNNFLLTFPFLYKTRLIQYESSLQANHGIEDLLEKMGTVLGVKGDIIECGSSRCGASIIMANYLISKGINKKIYACDTFCGFDKEEFQKEKRMGLCWAADDIFTSTSYEYVTKKIKKLGLQDIVVPVKGLFKDTLPHIKTDFCFALIDCDLKESLICATETIWPNLTSKGCIIFDDYTSGGWKGARLGIDFILNKYKPQILEHGLMRRLYYIIKK